jgi:Mrp family chromosome partitioning ATPase
VVTRPERIVVAETKRLLDDLRGRGIRIGGVIANYVTPADGDDCDASMRSHELAALEALGEDPVIIERRERPPMSAEELMSLVPL